MNCKLPSVYKDDQHVPQAVYVADETVPPQKRKDFYDSTDCDSIGTYTTKATTMTCPRSQSRRGSDDSASWDCATDDATLSAQHRPPQHRNFAAGHHLKALEVPGSLGRSDSFGSSGSLSSNSHIGTPTSRHSSICSSSMGDTDFEDLCRRSGRPALVPQLLPTPMHSTKQLSFRSQRDGDGDQDADSDGDASASGPSADVETAELLARSGSLSPILLRRGSSARGDFSRASTLQLSVSSSSSSECGLKSGDSYSTLVTGSPVAPQSPTGSPEKCSSPLLMENVAQGSPVNMLRRRSNTVQKMQMNGSWKSMAFSASASNLDTEDEPSKEQTSAVQLHIETKEPSSATAVQVPQEQRKHVRIQRAYSSPHDHELRLDHDAATSPSNQKTKIQRRNSSPLLGSLIESKTRWSSATALLKTRCWPPISPVDRVVLAQKLHSPTQLLRLKQKQLLLQTVDEEQMANEFASVAGVLSPPLTHRDSTEGACEQKISARGGQTC